METKTKKEVRQSAAKAIRTIIKAAKELSLAEQLLLESHSQKKQNKASVKEGAADE